MKVSDLFTGILFGILGIAVILYANTFPPLSGQDVGPALFPRVVGGGFVVCGVLLVIRHLRTSTPRAPLMSVAEQFHHVSNLTRFLLVPFVMIAYVIWADSLGFLVVAVPFLLILFLFFGVRPLTAVITAVLGALCIHFLFYKLLAVPLAWGLLDSIAW